MISLDILYINVLYVHHVMYQPSQLLNAVSASVMCGHADSTEDTVQEFVRFYQGSTMDGMLGYCWP